MWALVAHFGGAVGILVGGLLGWVAPLIAMVAKGNESPTVRAHAVAALNFQITWAIAMLVAIIAGIKANEGQLYEYQLSLKLIK